jgi:hypothetical protein
MTLLKIKKKLHEYIEKGDPKKVIAFYTMVEDELNEGSHWNDPSFVKEMDDRVKEFDLGKVKGVSWDIVKQRGLKKLKKAKRKAITG